MYKKEIDYLYKLFLQCEQYKKFMTLSTNEDDKKYYKNLIKHTMKEVSKVLNSDNIKKHRQSIEEFTIDDLKKFDGSNGTPAYVAVNEIVYDMSFVPTWGGGTHFGLYAGNDLTNEFKSCHVSEDILKKYPKVGILKK